MISIADVFDGFKSDGLKRKHIYEARLKSVAGLQGVRAKINGIAVEKMRRALAGEDAEELETELAKLADEEARIVRAAGVGRYSCEKCADTGLRDGNYCACLLDRVYHQCYGAVDIGGVTHGFDDFDTGVFDDIQVLGSGKTQRWLAERCMKAAKKYIAGFPDTGKRNMVITGKTGLGKTYLLECVAKAAKEKGIDVMLIRAGELFRLFFDHRMGEDVDLGFLYRADLLLADDIGTEPITNNVSVEYFYELVSKRLDAKKHTVYSTNIDDLQQRYDDRIASRLNSKEDSLMLLFDGGDLRSRK